MRRARTPLLGCIHANVDRFFPPLLHCANQIESEVSLSEQMKDGKKLALGDQCLGDIDSAVLFFSLSLASPLPLILSEMVCASSNLHNTLLTPLL